MTKNTVHAFTSITSNYLPKARVLAASAKQAMPDMGFHVMLCDNPPADFDLEQEPFDSLIRLDDLSIDRLRSWIFGHTVVELCTAVKGFAFQHLFDKRQAGKVFYFDPDMVVFGRMGELIERLDAHSVLLTPHQSEPENSLEAVADNELASLKHGVFNLGFLGVRASSQGKAFIDWWAQRLYHYCHDDICNGLFTDQKWANLAPCFFEDLEILRDPGFNVATWNLTNRQASGSLKDGVSINGKPLGFYHFSGFDSGAQEVMLTKYGQASPVLTELREWYVAECERQGQSELGKTPALYSRYEDGTPIPISHRLLYRTRTDLQEAFPDPFSRSDPCYCDWFGMHGFDPSDAIELSIGSDIPYSEALRRFLDFTETRLHASPRLGRRRKTLVRWLVSTLRAAAH